MKKKKYALTIRNIKDSLADLAEQERAGIFSNNKNLFNKGCQAAYKHVYCPMKH